MEVLNKHHFKNKKLPDNTVYIGRGSKWGNPFSHLENTKADYKVSTRDEAIEKYKEYLLSNEILLNSLNELKDMNLLCYCSPAKCHGHVLMELIDEQF